MAPSRHKGNPELLRTIRELRLAARRGDAPVWDAVADRLERARHPSSPINLDHLERLADPEETIVVPGKVLADGNLSKKVTVAAFAFSAVAREKIVAAGGSAISFRELLKIRPDGAGVHLLA